MITVALLPGDGVGSEVLAGPSVLAGWLAEFGALSTTGPWQVGSTAFAAHGTTLPAETLKACEESDAILLGAIGVQPGVSLPTGVLPETSLVELRRHFDLRVSVREVWRSDGGTLTFVRNLLGGMYGASETRHESDGTASASDLVELAPGHIREVVDLGIDLLSQAQAASLISVDKANLLATSRLWRRVAGQAAATRGVDVDHVHVDRFAYELANRAFPNAVVVTEGLFGDILSDLACGRAGSIALCSSASIRPGDRSGQRCLGLFEPIHGSAPLHAGADRVNPLGGYLALVALLASFPETSEWSQVLRSAIRRALDSGARTYELAPEGQLPVSTSAMSELINDHFYALATNTSVDS